MLKSMSLMLTKVLLGPQWWWEKPVGPSVELEQNADAISRTVDLDAPLQIPQGPLATTTIQTGRATGAAVAPCRAASAWTEASRQWWDASACQKKLVRLALDGSMGDSMAQSLPRLPGQKLNVHLEHLCGQSRAMAMGKRDPLFPSQKGVHAGM